MRRSDACPKSDPPQNAVTRAPQGTRRPTRTAARPGRVRGACRDPGDAPSGRAETDRAGREAGHAVGARRTQRWGRPPSVPRRPRTRARSGAGRSRRRSIHPHRWNGARAGHRLATRRGVEGCASRCASPLQPEPFHPWQRMQIRVFRGTVGYAPNSDPCWKIAAHSVPPLWNGAGRGTRCRPGSTRCVRAHGSAARASAGALLRTYSRTPSSPQEALSGTALA